MSELRHDSWAGTTYGNGFMHRWLIKLLKAVDVRIVYAVANVLVVPPTMAVNGKARKTTYAFYRKGLSLGKMRSLWMTYRNHCAFSQVVIDKFAMYAGKQFHIDIDGYDKFLELANKPDGFIQLSSHIGNYEIAGYSLVAATKRFNALVFGGEKDSIMANRQRMFGRNNIRMIAVKEDMSHLFELNAALADGEIVSMPADRVFGSPKHFVIDFLGRPAAFPQGPFVLAAARAVAMLFVSVIKSSSKGYHITVRELASAPAATSKATARQLAENYVKMLEAAVLSHPEQWYNYFDFWAK